MTEAFIISMLQGPASTTISSGLVYLNKHKYLRLE